jgi:hypothetical protein
MTHHPTAHMVYKNMVNIKKHLQKAITDSPRHIVELVKPMQEKYNKYWEKMNFFASITIVFDPCYKLDLVKFIISGPNPPAISTSLNLLRQTLSEWYDEVALTLRKKTKSITRKI